MMLSVIIGLVCSVPSSSTKNWMGLACGSRIVRKSRLPLASSASFIAKSFLRSLYSSWISRCTCCSMFRMALCRFFIKATHEVGVSLVMLVCCVHIPLCTAFSQVLRTSVGRALRLVCLDFLTCCTILCICLLSQCCSVAVVEKAACIVILENL